MKHFIFGFCATLAFANGVFAIWEHNLNLAGAWASSCFGWLSALFANLALDDERK